MAKDNMSFMVCCANGAGSSLMMKMTLEKTWQEQIQKLKRTEPGACLKFIPDICMLRFAEKEAA